MLDEREEDELYKQSLKDRIDDWLFNPEPRIKPDNPNSVMSKVSNVLGDSIDGLSNLIVNAGIWFSGVPLRLMMKVDEMINGCRCRACVNE